MTRVEVSFVGSRD